MIALLVVGCVIAYLAIGIAVARVLRGRGELGGDPFLSGFFVLTWAAFSPYALLGLVLWGLGRLAGDRSRW